MPAFAQKEQPYSQAARHGLLLVSSPVLKTMGDPERDYGSSTPVYSGSYDENDPSLSVSVHAQPGSFLNPYAPQFNALDFSVDGNADYLFADDHNKGRTWGEKVFYATGGSYLIGSMVGGAWGLAEGLRNPDAVTQRLRINSVLNAVTRRGPFVGNFSAVVALMYTMIDGMVVKARNGEDDMFNAVGSAVATGVLFKATAGPRRMAVAGVLGAGMAGVGLAARKFLLEQRIFY